MASSAIANAFSGFLKGWDNETDRQTRQADAAEARTRNAEMFGLQKQALQFNLQDMERKALLGSAQFSTSSDWHRKRQTRSLSRPQHALLSETLRPRPLQLRRPPNSAS
jgi:hypothetical protein